MYTAETPLGTDGGSVSRSERIPEELVLSRPRADPEKITAPAKTRPATPYAAALVLSFNYRSPGCSFEKFPLMGIINQCF